MFNLKLSPPVNLYGHTVCSLEDAAYLLRQKAIADNDSDARLFVRRLRDTNDLTSALLCVEQLRERAAKSAPTCAMSPKPGRVTPLRTASTARKDFGDKDKGD